MSQSTSSVNQAPESLFNIESIGRSVWLQDAALVLAGSCLALLLGLISAATALLVGPLFKLFMAEPQFVFRLADIFHHPALLSMMTALFGKEVVSQGEMLGILPWVFLGLSFLKFFSQAGNWFIWEFIGESSAYNVRSQLIERYLHLRPQARLLDSQVSKGDSAARSLDSQMAAIVSFDVMYLKEYIVRLWGGLPREIIKASCVLTLILLISTKLFLVFLLALVPIALLIRLIGKKLKRRFKQSMVSFSDYSEWLQSRLMGIETIKHYRSEAAEFSKFKEMDDHLIRRYLKFYKTQSLVSPFMEMAGILGLGMIIYVSLEAVVNELINPTLYLSFMVLVASLGQDLSTMAKYYAKLKEGKLAQARIQKTAQQLRSEQIPFLKRTVDTGIQAALQIENLSFSYPGSSAVLKNCSYRFERGKAYSISGPSGSGKSTLIRLVLGVLTPNNGSITYQSDDVIYVPQDVQLQRGTIAANIAYPDLEIDVARVKAAAAKAGFPLDEKGSEIRFNTPVKSAKSNLSGGESQRLLLARIFYHEESKVIIFDEPTSALDPKTERVFLESINALKCSNKTIIMISHRQAPLAIADHRLALHDGKLIEN